MNPRLQSALIFLRLIDSFDGNVSLTNVALAVVLAKLVVAPAVGLTEIGGLFIALASYQGKKIINRDAGGPDVNLLQPQFEQMTNTIEEIQSKVSSLSLQAGIKTLGKQ